MHETLYAGVYSIQGILHMVRYTELNQLLTRTCRGIGGRENAPAFPDADGAATGGADQVPWKDAGAEAVRRYKTEHSMQ